MELTTEQALQQGVTAHQEGKLQDAERLYRAILQSQPAHPDANHNLGLIAVSVNKTDAALPLFKTALEANPKIEQFWLSYIDALIKEKQFDNAKKVIQQGKQKGVDKEKLNTLYAKIGSINKQKNIDSTSPSQAQIDTLLEHYKNGRLGAAENLSMSITQQFPAHQFGWKVLGAVLKQTGRITDSLTPMQKSVQLAPQDAEAHNNLGNTLKELGRLDEAEASCRQAIALKSDYAEAHSNLGHTLKELGRFDEAEASYKQAIVLKPDFAQAHYNLSNMLKELDRLDEAEASYKQVMALKPENIKAHSQLLICLFTQDKKSVFFDELDYLINQDKANAVIGSLTCRSALKYGLEKPNLFCTKPLNYVLHNDLNTRYDFGKTFVKKAKSILNENRILNRRQSLLVNGNQTLGNIFDIENDDTNEIQNIIRAEVEKYREKFKKSEEGLIKKCQLSTVSMAGSSV
jgi:tetratricopeptide (TPR) repeat protein